MVFFFFLLTRAGDIWQKKNPISYDIDIYHNINLRLMRKEILSTYLLDLEIECKQLNFTDIATFYFFHFNYFICSSYKAIYKLLN